MAIDKIQSESINLADNFAFTGTVSGAGGVNTPVFLIRQNSATSIPNATRTKVSLDTADIDTDSGLDSTNKRWVVPSGKAGKYQLFYQLRYETASNFDDCNIMIYKNGIHFGGYKLI